MKANNLDKQERNKKIKLLKKRIKVFKMQIRALKKAKSIEGV